MKICDITQFYSPISGGVRRYLQAKIDWLQQNRPDAKHILIVPGEDTSCRESLGSRRHTVRSPLLSSSSRYRALLDFEVVRQIIENEKPDVIECGDPYQIAWKVLSIGASLNIPVVGFYHSHLPEIFRSGTSRYLGTKTGNLAHGMARYYVQNLYRRFARTLVPSAALERLLQSWNIPRTALVKLGVDTTLFHPGEPCTRFRTEHGIPSEARLLLYVGRLAPEKNLPTLFSAFERLHQDSPGRFHLLAVGDGSTRERLLRLQNRTKAVTWLPWCTDSVQLAKYYRAADFLVHPGMQETFGLVALESQACGTPVTGIRGSCLDETIFHDQAHWATENSPESLAAAMGSLTTPDARILGQKACEQVQSDCAWDGVFQKLFAIYESLG